MATQFINVQLAESTIDLAQQDLKKSFNKLWISARANLRPAELSENDYLMIELQLLQFETDLESAQLARAQGLSDMRQLLGYESVSPEYDVVDAFDYLPPQGQRLKICRCRRCRTRPDLRAAVQGVTAANSGFLLAKANGVKPISPSRGTTPATVVRTSRAFLRASRSRYSTATRA